MSTSSLEEELSEEQYWLNLLGELGSQPDPPQENNEKETGYSEYQFLDIQFTDNPTTTSFSNNNLYQESFSEEIMPDFLARSVLQQRIEEEEEEEVLTTATGGGEHDDERTRQKQEEESLHLSRLQQLKKYSIEDHVQEKTRDVWRDQFSANFDLIRSELVFETLDDLLPEEPQVVSLPSYSSSPVKESNWDREEKIVVHRVEVPKDLDSSPSLVGTVLPSTQLLTKGLSTGAEMSSNLISSLLWHSQRGLRELGVLAGQQLIQRLNDNAVIQAIKDAVQEAHGSAYDQITNWKYFLDRLPSRHREFIERAQSWQAVFWRFSLGSLRWSDRQLIDETRDRYASDDLFIQKHLAGGQLAGEIDLPVPEECINDTSQAMDLLKKYFQPPRFQESNQCAHCHRAFGLTCYRYHCHRCGKSVCEQDSPFRRPLFRFGLLHPVRVCRDCVVEVDEVYAKERRRWLESRLKAFSNGRLIAYPYPGGQQPPSGTTPNYSLVLAHHALILANPSQALSSTARIIARSGLKGLGEIVQDPATMATIETLLHILPLAEIFPRYSSAEIAACMAYRLAVERGLRGCAPDSEMLAHQLRQGCQNTSDEDLQHLLRYAPLALNVIYEDEPADMQRLAALQGLTLVATLSLPPSLQDNPVQKNLTFAVFLSGSVRAHPVSVTSPTKEAVIVLRSHLSVEAVALLMAQYEHELNGDEQDVIVAMPTLSDVAALLPDLPMPTDLTEYPIQCGKVHRHVLELTVSLLTEIAPMLHSIHEEGYQITIVGHCLGGAVAAMAAYLLRPFFSSYFSQVVGQINIKSIGYASPSAFSLSLSHAMRVFNGHREVFWRDDWLPRFSVMAKRRCFREMVVFRNQVFQNPEQGWKEVLARTMQAMHVMRSHASTNRVSYRVHTSAPDGTAMIDSGDIVTPPIVPSSVKDEDGVLVEEEKEVKVIQLYVAGGQVTHLFTVRGQILASDVSVDSPILQKLSLHPNALLDHSNAYLLNALLEARAVRRGGLQVCPAWQPYHDSALCTLCHNSFSWSTLIQSPGQEYRDRHNCRHCGCLVCSACSKERRCIPKYGMVVIPRRLCDRCLLSGDYAY